MPGIDFILGMKPPQEFFLLLGLALVLYITRKKKWLPDNLYGRELPITVTLGAFGILIPTGVSTVLVISYVCWRIFSSATYDLCPACWDRLGRMLNKKKE